MISQFAPAHEQLACSSSFDCNDHMRISKPTTGARSGRSRYSTLMSGDYHVSNTAASTASTSFSASTVDSATISPPSSDGGHRHRRRRSSVSFVEQPPEIVEFEWCNNDPKEIWFSKEELRNIRSQCKRIAHQTEQNDGVIQRGLEHMVPRSSPRHSRARRNSKQIVTMEQANQILEYGNICDTERLAEEYKRATESSKRQALLRGFADAERAWGKAVSPQE